MLPREPASFWPENATAVAIRRHSSFRENVVVAKTSYQMLEALSFCEWERAYPPSIKITVLTFLVIQKYNEAFQGSLLLENTLKKTFSQISYS